LIKAKDLRKVYSNGYLAVQDNTFGVKEHQVLGLLGPNGAGKSSTFAMLTME
jgi:ATP-binding cassette subfamily A (ABC1) protein 3